MTSLKILQSENPSGYGSQCNVNYSILSSLLLPTTVNFFLCISFHLFHKYFLFSVPVDCVWGEFGTCSVTCGGGTQIRTVLTEAANGGAPCPGSDTQTCNEDPCPGEC